MEEVGHSRLQEGITHVEEIFLAIKFLTNLLFDSYSPPITGTAGAGTAGPITAAPGSLGYNEVRNMNAYSKESKLQ